MALHPPSFDLQAVRREMLYAAHRRSMDLYWGEDGSFIWKDPAGYSGYRAALWHCLAYYAGDAREQARADAIVLRHQENRPCHFAPGAALDLLHHHRAVMAPAAVAVLERLIRLHLPYMGTEDLKIQGYNDNHVFKAIHVLILGGEMFDKPDLVQRGLRRLHDAIAVFRRNGFPCEYNSPNYAPVSLNPLANLAERAIDAEAKELALQLERFYWQDVALHFDFRAGVPAGPFSRGAANDFSGLLSGTLSLLSHLFPERFGFDLNKELYERGGETRLISESDRKLLPFIQAHPVWYAGATYHMTPAIEQVLFAKTDGATVLGTAETGAAEIGWKQPEDRPKGAPDVLRLSCRRTLLTTYYGKGFSLGTSRYMWLDGKQAYGFYATLSGPGRPGPANAAVYFARMFFDENTPASEISTESIDGWFNDGGEMRTLQYRNSALVFYNPLPRRRSFRRLRTAVFRPLRFSRPKMVYVGETRVADLNYVGERMEAIAIDEGDVYVGILPLRLTDLGQCRCCHLHLHDYGGQLWITMSSFEGWAEKEFSYDEIVRTNSGFVFEIQPANRFRDFAAFRSWLAEAQIKDQFYAEMRTTSYRREGLELSSSYSPLGSFRYAAVNGAPAAETSFALDGINDPGAGFVLPEQKF